jgi:hypothetical protein
VKILTKNKFRVIVSSISLATLLIVPAISNASSNPQQEQLLPNVNKQQDNRFDIEKNSKFRETFGLDNEQSHIQILINQEKSLLTGKGKKYGVVLTQNEEEALDKRIDLQKSGIPKIKEYIKENIKDGSFAGIYIDPKNGGIVNIGFKGSLDKLNKEANDINNLYGTPQLIKFYEATYTEDELNDLHQKVDDSRFEIEKAGIKLVSVRTLLPEQKVAIGIENLNVDAIATLNKMFDKNMIVIKQEVPSFQMTSSKSNYGSVPGGLSINKGGSYECTAGFSAQGGSTTYIVTAGHCISTIGETWYQGGRSIGTSAAKSSSSYADAGLIQVSPDKLSHYIYANNNPTFMTITSTTPLGGETVGDTVCVSGGTTDNSSCGTVTNTNFSGDVNGNGYYSGQTEANYFAKGGDSGGPTFFAYQLMGVHVATNLNNSYDNLYSKAARVLSNLGVTAITGY